MEAEIRVMQPHAEEPKDGGDQEKLEEAWTRFPALAARGTCPADNDSYSFLTSDSRTITINLCCFLATKIQ